MSFGKSLTLLACFCLVFGVFTGINVVFIESQAWVSSKIFQYAIALGVSLVETAGLVEMCKDVAGIASRFGTSRFTPSSEPARVRTVPIDGAALQQYRERKGWTPAKLAHMADDMAIGVVEKAERGDLIEPSFVTKIAKALGILPVEIMPAEQSLATPPDVDVRRRRRVLSIILKATSEQFQLFLQQKNELAKRLFGALRHAGLLTGESRLRQVTEGSIRIVASVDVKDAWSIKMASRRHELDFLGITDVIVESSRIFWVRAGAILLGILSPVGLILGLPSVVAGIGAVVALLLGAIGWWLERSSKEAS